MVNFRDPAVVAKDSFALLKLWHVVDGLFLWEFITTLDFEWSIIQRRRSYRWTIWIYSFSRVTTLTAVIANLVVLNLNTSVSCTFSMILVSVSAYLALAAASLLLVIRVIAIWNRNKVVAVIAITIWTINSAFFIQGISQVRYTTKVFPGGYCTTLNVQASKAAIVVSFVADLLLLIIMLVGLFRLDCHRNGASATGRILWNQGVIWLLLAIVAGVVPTVFACLDLNEPLSSIFRIPWIIAMSIAATRMYRALNVALSSDIAHVPSHSNGGRTITVSGIWGSPAVPVSLNGIKVDVDVHTVDNHSPTSQAIRHSLDSNMDNQPQDKPHELV
ncbi:hypothetical protein DFH94DRAFT_20344 [Russula ochroleuca]|uniref:Uncharacterized protein n=1 Tax=Russula ochroleuca TaxID=152965 RepID=A0A9P5TEV4_9AGAM|nr:hypothetical protein DFH94DRAFT_20344 [Russula ochroleuca]